MKKHLLLIPAVAALLVACESNQRAPQADNTEVNARDRNDTLTPADQSNKDSDLRITQKIRQRLIKDNNLSENAKNIKIITINGQVTLRGPVDNAREKSIVVGIAKNVEGVSNVDDQIDVIQK